MDWGWRTAVRRGRRLDPSYGSTAHPSPCRQPLLHVVAITVSRCHPGCMNQDSSVASARDALLAAARSSERLRLRARWAITKLAVFGVAIGLVTVAVGLIESKLLGTAVFAGWLVLAVGMSAWERSRRAHLPGTRERTSVYW